MAPHRRFDDGAVTTALFRRRCLCHWFFTDIFRLKCHLPSPHWPFSDLFLLRSRVHTSTMETLLWDKRRTGPGDLCSWMLK
ncbi:Gibberellin-regulated protein 4 [Frankliniella fusca]|uniref:Gibberellin-regulated protein 4 n=1 Tax=Frankliniella fusca TaxID=407009 RepID=A0AAE1LMY9_9NEOP|nr:Gibberellin-regulated protein 4 [Frankliniella fusca]